MTAAMRTEFFAKYWEPPSRVAEIVAGQPARQVGGRLLASRPHLMPTRAARGRRVRGAGCDASSSIAPPLDIQAVEAAFSGGLMGSRNLFDEAPHGADA